MAEIRAGLKASSLTRFARIDLDEGATAPSLTPDVHFFLLAFFAALAMPLRLSFSLPFALGGLD